MKANKSPSYRICIALIVAHLVLLNIAKAQRIEGLYLTAEDFSQNKLTYGKDEKRKFKIKLHSLRISSPIKIFYGDSVFQLNKDSIFGYKNYDRVSFRFFNKIVYTIINPQEKIVLYKILHSSKSKYQDETYHYYFSMDASSPVFPLSIYNLDLHFKANKDFVDFIEIHFTNNKDLLEYDSNHKMYKINRLYELSINKNN